MPEGYIQMNYSTSRTIKIKKAGQYLLISSFLLNPSALSPFYLSLLQCTRTFWSILILIEYIRRLGGGVQGSTNLDIGTSLSSSSLSSLLVLPLTFSHLSLATCVSFVPLLLPPLVFPHVEKVISMLRVPSFEKISRYSQRH